jgi:DNA-binding CsgD family transcriptional regulator
VVISENAVRGGHVPRDVGAAAERALAARGDARALSRVIDRNAVPMLTVDGERRCIDANRPARLALRLSLEQLRGYTIDDLTPPVALDSLESSWAHLLETECVAGTSELTGPDATSPLDIVFCALANVLPAVHLIVFAPADWPEDELDTMRPAQNGPPSPLTRREIEVLELAAEGSSVPELGDELGLSPDTVRTHLKSIYAKLDVHNRTAAVTRAMRLGVIDC